MHLDDLKPQTVNCRRLIDAWKPWRGENLVPRRADMRLEDITEILPWIAVADIISETEVTIRLAGTMIREVLGVELTGRNLLELTEPEHRAARGARSARLAAQPCGAIWIWNLAFADQHSRPAENLCLPMRPNADGRPMQMLNVFGMLSSEYPPQAINHYQQVAPSAQHSFIDIGAGIPES